MAIGTTPRRILIAVVLLWAAAAAPLRVSAAGLAGMTAPMDPAFFSYDSSLPLRGTQVLEQRLPSYSRFHVTYQVEGQTVHAAYFRPSGPGPYAAVVGIHGIYSADKTQFWPVAEELARRGIAVLMPSLPFHHERKPKGTLISGQGIIVKDSKETTRNFRRAVVEARRGLDWLSIQPDVDPERIGCMGVSLGALVSSLALKVDGRFAAGVIVVGGCDLGDVVRTSGTFMAGVIRFWDRLDMADLGAMSADWPKIDPSLYADTRPRPILMVNGARDAIFSPYHVTTLADSWSSVTQFWTDGGHYYPVQLASYQTALWFRAALAGPRPLALMGASVTEDPEPIEVGDGHLKLRLEFQLPDQSVARGHSVAIPMVDARAPVLVGTAGALASARGLMGGWGPWVYYEVPDDTVGSVALAARYIAECSAADLSRVYSLEQNGPPYAWRLDASVLLRFSGISPRDPAPLGSSGLRIEASASAIRRVQDAANKTLKPRHAAKAPNPQRWAQPVAWRDLALVVRSASSYIAQQFGSLGLGLFYYQ